MDHKEYPDWDELFLPEETPEEVAADAPPAQEEAGLIPANPAPEEAEPPLWADPETVLPEEDNWIPLPGQEELPEDISPEPLSEELVPAEESEVPGFTGEEAVLPAAGYSPNDIFAGLPGFEAEPVPPVPTEPGEVWAQPKEIQDAPPVPPQEDPLLPEPELPEEPIQAPDVLGQELLEVNQLLEEKPSDRKFQETEDDPEQFAQMVNAKPQKEPIPSHSRPARKGRPRRKKGQGLLGIPNILSAMIWLAITLAIGVTLGRMLWACAADVLAFGREDRAVTITIYESDTIEDIADKLHRNNLIRYPGLFKLYAKLAVDDGEIRPGIWDLNTRYDYHALVNMMSPSSNRKVVELMIPEGYSCRQIFALMEENKVCTAADLAAYAASGELDEYWFLAEVVRGEDTCLEGFLFPDTYQFYTNDSPRSVLQKMLDNFDSRFTEEMAAQLPVLNERISQMMADDGRSQEYIDSHQLTLRDVVIVASMIEKETSSAEEGYTIASVIYNRLYNWGDTPAYLNIDASMVYALGKTDITAEDLRIDHPYNTYLYTGLTPGPISNPGLSSIEAALDPSATNYYYYVLDPAAGAHHFSTTYEEHQAFIASLGE